MSDFLVIDQEKCIGCGLCLTDCSTRLFVFTEADKPPKIKENAEDICIQCGHCLCCCPNDAITLNGKTTAEAVPVDQKRIPSFEQVLELVKYRRSIRNYQKTPLTQEDLDKIFELLKWAPTAKNLLQLKWCVINGWDKVHKVAGMIADSLRGDESCQKIVETWDKGYDGILRDAPCLIFAYNEDPDSAWTMTDGAIAAEILDLGVASLGIGACWAGLFMIFAARSKELYKMLGLPEGARIGGALMLGYPASEKYKKAPPRPECKVNFID